MRMKDLLNELQRDLPETLKLLEAMVNMDSPSPDKPLVDQFVRFVGSQFEAIGGRVEYVPAERFGDHLLVRFDGPSEDRVLLLGHTDTVFAPGESGRRRFKIENNRATGPGVFDMKAGIVLMRSALRALRPLPRPVTILLTSDEEIGSPSSRELIEREARLATAVLVFEPSLPGGALKTARKGVGRFTIKAAGRAAHAGIDLAKGVNAIEEIAHQVLRLQRLSDPGRRNKCYCWTGTGWNSRQCCARRGGRGHRCPNHQQRRSGANHRDDPWIATLPGWRDPSDSWRNQSSAHGTNPGYGSTF